MEDEMKPLRDIAPALADSRAWRMLVANNALVYCAHPLPLFFAATRLHGGPDLDSLVPPSLAQWLPCPPNMLGLLVFTYVSLAVISVVVRHTPLIDACFFRVRSVIKRE